MQSGERKFDIRRFERTLIIVILDALSIAFSFFIALLLRFEFSFAAIPKEYIAGFSSSIIFWIVISIVVFALFKLYNAIWSYVGIDILIRTIMAYIVLVATGILFAFIAKIDMPKSYYIIGFCLSAVLTVCLRFSYRVYLEIRQILHEEAGSERIMIIGAGEVGKALIREYNANKKLKGKIVCLIDDNNDKKNKFLDGVKIVGNRYDIPTAVKKYHVDKIVFAITVSTVNARSEILDICSKTGCKTLTVPGILKAVDENVTVSKLRNVEIQDLLGREPIKVNLDEIYKYISGKVVMVTGGGGSIGSELCRQIAKAGPEKLILFDIYENNAYDIQMELNRHLPQLDLEVLIGSVRNTSRIEYILEKYKPEIIFHAAAHKHVPLMEDSPNEAIKNNVFGTYKLALAAEKYKVRKFVLISTDRAVNPTNIMGASKRLCEMVVQMMNRKSQDTDFVAVRFGNVLGSNGSVVPLFKKQIEEGGPVTVTHPEITRFFMTIPEAVALVLQAGYYAKGGEIFVLDMGKPVKIDDMARNLIRLSGYEPDVDIKIVYTGLRPGEKLYEELLMSEEGLQSTENELIHIGKPIEMDDEKFVEDLKRLEAAFKSEAENIKDIVAEIVPTYHRKK